MKKETFYGEKYIIDRMNEMGWQDQYNFTKILAAGNSMISIQPVEEGFTRWEMHQKWNRDMHNKRSMNVCVPIVIGFFRKGEAEELSLFEGRLFDQPYDKELVIGRGCQDMAIDLWANWDTSVDQPFDVDFSMGGEEFYSAIHREYNRCSMSGRHDYLLKILPDNRAVVLQVKQVKNEGVEP